MPIRSDLELDTTDARDAVEELAEFMVEQFEVAAASLADAVSAAVDQLAAAEVEIAADTSQIGPEVDAALAATTEIELLADTGAIPPDIEAAIADADTAVEIEVSGIEGLQASIEEAVSGADTTIEVGVDTGGAEQTQEELADALQDTGESAREAASGLSVAEGVATVLGTTSQLSVARLGRLNTATALLPGRLGILGGVLTTVGLSGQNFASAAIEADASLDRFNVTLGDFAAEVEQIDIGNLNRDLSELALSLGTDDDAFRQTAATIVQSAEAAGISADAAALQAESILALASAAVAANPALGDAATVANRMSIALARGGRFANQFAIALTPAEIRARAAENAIEGLGDGVSIQALAFAGTELAIEKYGNTLDQRISQGLRNPIIRQRSLNQTLDEARESLGRPLVAPLFDVLEAGLPTAIDLAEAIATLSQIGLPAIEALLEILGAVLTVVQPFLDLIGSIPEPVIAAATAFFVLDRAVNILATSAATRGLPALAGLLGPIGLLVATVGAAAVAFGVFNRNREEERRQIEQTAQSLFPELVARQDVTEATNEQREALDGLTTATEQYLATQSRFSETKEQLDDLDRIGVSISDLSGLLTQGEQGLRDFVEAAIAAGEVSIDPNAQLFNFEQASTDAERLDLVLRDLASGGTVDQFGNRIEDLHDLTQVLFEGNEDLIESFLRERDALNSAGESALTFGVVSGRITEAQRQAAIEQTRLADGTENYAAAAEFATNETELLVELTGEMTEAQGILLGRLQESTPEIEASATAWQVLANAIALGQVSITDFQSIAERFGTSATVISQFADLVEREMARVSDSITQALPGTGEFSSGFISDIESAQEAVSSATDRLNESNTEMLERLGAGLDSQRRSVRDAAAAVRDANAELDEAVADARFAGRDQETQEAVARAIDRANEQVESATDRVSDATQRFNDSQADLAAAAADARKVVTDAQDEMTAAQEELLAALDPQRLIERLQAQADAIQNFEDNIAVLIAQGNERAAEEALRLGPEVGGQLAQGLIDAGPDVARATDEALTNVDLQTDELATRIRDEFVPSMPQIGADAAAALAEEFGINLVDVPADAQETLNAVAQVFGADSPQFTEAVRLLGVNASTAFGEALNDPFTGLGSQALFAAQAATRAVQDQFPGLDAAFAAEIAAGGDPFAAFSADLGAPDLAPLAESISSQVRTAVESATATAETETRQRFEDLGEGFVQGLTRGVENSKASSDEALRAWIAGLEAAARAEAEAESPSQVFARLGGDLVLGAVDGINANADLAVAAGATIADKVEQGFIAELSDTEEIEAAIAEWLEAIETITVEQIAGGALAAIPAPVAVALPAVAAVGSSTSGLDEATAAALRSLAGTLESGVKAARPIEQTFNQPIDPQHAAAEVAWELTR